jgi:hypothetical protein
MDFCYECTEKEAHKTNLYKENENVGCSDIHKVVEKSDMEDNSETVEMNPIEDNSKTVQNHIELNVEEKVDKVVVKCTKCEIEETKNQCKCK